MIVGLGRIGKVVAQMMTGFDMDIYYVDPVEAPAVFAAKYGLKKVSLEDGLALADYVILNCALTDQNRLMISAPQLRMTRPEAYLINCARGPLVSEADLVAAALAAQPNVALSPHAGNATVEARVEMAADAARNAVRFLTGEPLDYVVTLATP